MVVIEGEVGLVTAILVYFWTGGEVTHNFITKIIYILYYF